MIDSIAKKYANVIVKSLPDNGFEEDRIEYGIKFLLTNVTPILLVALYGFFTNEIADILLALSGFCLLRMVSGGYHIKTPEICIIVSLVMIYSLSQFGYLVSGYLVYINLMSLILVSALAPSNIRDQTLIPEEYDIHLRIISIVIVVLSMFINNEIITVSIFAQSLTLINSWRGGEEE